MEKSLITNLDGSVSSDSLEQINDLLNPIPKDSVEDHGLTRYFRDLQRAKSDLLMVVIDKSLINTGKLVHLTTSGRKKPSVGHIAQVLNIIDKTELYGDVVANIEDEDIDNIVFDAVIESGCLPKDFRDSLIEFQSNNNLTKMKLYRPDNFPLLSIIMIPIKPLFLKMVESNQEFEEVSHNVVNDREAWVEPAATNDTEYGQTQPKKASLIQCIIDWFKGLLK